MNEGMTPDEKQAHRIADAIHRMGQAYKTSDADAKIKELEKCCLKGMPEGYRVLQVPHMIESENDSHGGWIVCEISYPTGKPPSVLQEVRWAVVNDSQDYTGHG